MKQLFLNSNIQLQIPITLTQPSEHTKIELPHLAERSSGYVNQNFEYACSDNNVDAVAKEPRRTHLLK